MRESEQQPMGMAALSRQSPKPEGARPWRAGLTANARAEQ